MYRMGGSGRAGARRGPGGSAAGPATRLLMAAALVLAPACERTPSTAPDESFTRTEDGRHTIYYGPAARVGQGVGRSYFIRSGETVREVGVALSEAALNGLPDGSGHWSGPHDHFNEFVLQFHPQNSTPYRFIGLNWNASGHEPEHVYGTPHFDFHFYTIDLEERNTILPSDPQWSEKANRVPAPERIPERYVPAAPPIPDISLGDVAVPLMGVHWVDAASPELQPGGAFTETFIFGTWNGRVIFAEPMITRAFLETRPDHRRALPRPAEGYTPGAYHIYWNEKTREYRIALTDLPGS